MVTNVPRLGDPADGESLGERHLDYWGKATGPSSNLGYGLIVLNTPGGNCALATDGDFGEFGMVVRLFPNYNPDIHSAKSSGVVNPPPTGVINTEDSNKVLVMKGPGARGYMKLSASPGTVTPRSRLVASSGGLLKLYVEPTWTSSTPANFNSPMRDYKTIVGEYEGHYGESMVSLDKQPTNGSANETVRVRFGSYPV